MKKFFCGLMAAAMLITTLSSCGNRQFFDATYTFEKAMLVLPNGNVVSGKLSSWRDYEDGDQIQVVIDGVTYLTHVSNVVMIHE